MKARKYSSKTIAFPASIQQGSFRHAKLVFEGIDQSGPSYQARIFFNNPRANESTPMTPERGYAGKFHVFGNGRCWGDEGHCDMPQTRREFDNRSPHPLTPRQATVNVTAGLLKAVKEGTRLAITIVPVVNTAVDPKTVARCLQFEGLSLQIRSSHGLLEDPFLNP